MFAILTKCECVWARAGFDVAEYDFHYSAAPQPLQSPAAYHFITCLDTFSCLRHPMRELRALQTVLRPGGVLALQQPLCEEDVRFEQWPYKDSAVRVLFVRRRTLEWVARQLRWEVSMPEPDITLFHKPG